VDHNGEPAGSIEVIYLDNATGQPEWALLEAAAAAGRAPTFVPLVGASDEGDAVRVPFDKALVDGAPSVPADRELSEDEEGELYRHYGAGGGALPEAAVPESAPISAGDVRPAPARVDVPAPDAAATGDGLAARLRQLPITDLWLGAGAVALAVAAGIWRRETIGRQVGTAVGRLAAIPGRSAASAAGAAAPRRSIRR
jgi:hypothetical protein